MKFITSTDLFSTESASKNKKKEETKKEKRSKGKALPVLFDGKEKEKKRSDCVLAAIIHTVIWDFTS